MLSKKLNPAWECPKRVNSIKDYLAGRELERVLRLLHQKNRTDETVSGSKFSTSGFGSPPNRPKITGIRSNVTHEGNQASTAFDVLTKRAWLTKEPNPASERPKQQLTETTVNSGSAGQDVERIWPFRHSLNEPVSESKVSTSGFWSPPNRPKITGIRSNGTNEGNQGNAFHERICLARAIQSNIEQLVDNLIFTGSELPDELAQDSVVTDEENNEIRNISNRKDQIRVLISIINGRDLRVLQRFVERISKTNKHIATKINLEFEENKISLKSKSSCAFCEMIENVSVKYVVDGLWSISAIGNGLFADIARCSHSSEKQSKLWMRLIDSLNNADKALKEKAYNRLVKSLWSKNHYKHIAGGISSCIDKCGKLECKCKVTFCTSAGSISGATTVSPMSLSSDDHTSVETVSQTSELTVDGQAEPNTTDVGDIVHETEGTADTSDMCEQISPTKRRVRLSRLARHMVQVGPIFNHSRDIPKRIKQRQAGWFPKWSAE